MSASWWPSAKTLDAGCCLGALLLGSGFVASPRQALGCVAALCRASIPAWVVRRSGCTWAPCIPIPGRRQERRSTKPTCGCSSSPIEAIVRWGSALTCSDVDASVRPPCRLYAADFSSASTQSRTFKTLAAMAIRTFSLRREESSCSENSIRLEAGTPNTAA